MRARISTVSAAHKIQNVGIAKNVVRYWKTNAAHSVNVRNGGYLNDRTPFGVLIPSSVQKDFNTMETTLSTSTFFYNVRGHKLKKLSEMDYS
jgi:hypothetical protein